MKTCLLNLTDEEVYDQIIQLCMQAQLKGLKITSMEVTEDQFISLLKSSALKTLIDANSFSILGPSGPLEVSKKPKEFK